MINLEGIASTGLAFFDAAVTSQIDALVSIKDGIEKLNSQLTAALREKQILQRTVYRLNEELDILKRSQEENHQPIACNHRIQTPPIDIEVKVEEDPENSSHKPSQKVTINEVDTNVSVELSESISTNRDPKYGPFTIENTRNSHIGTEVKLVPALSLNASYARKRKQRRYGIRLAERRDSVRIPTVSDARSSKVPDLTLVGSFGSVSSTTAMPTSVSVSTVLRSRKNQSAVEVLNEEWSVPEHKTRRYRNTELSMVSTGEIQRNSGKVIRAKSTGIPDVVEDLLESIYCTKKSEDQRVVDVLPENMENSLTSLVEDHTSTFAQTSRLGSQTVLHCTEARPIADEKEVHLLEAGYETYKEKCKENGVVFQDADILESGRESHESGTVEIRHADSITTMEAFPSQSQYSNQIYTMSKPTDSQVVGAEDFSTASMAFIGEEELHVDMYCAEKALTCKLCPKTFPHQRQLAKHIAGHYREKPFQCNMCGKCFGQRGHLSTHMRIHSGEKPYKCKICKRDFSQKVNLNTHMRKHSGERPYKCVVCGKAFYDQGNCLKHTRTHSREKRKSKSS